MGIVYHCVDVSTEVYCECSEWYWRTRDGEEGWSKSQSGLVSDSDKTSNVIVDDHVPDQISFMNNKGLIYRRFMYKVLKYTGGLIELKRNFFLWPVPLHPLEGVFRGSFVRERNFS